jgi:predicted ATP-grasp superfamily ATP-dependent carboligase
MKQAGQLLALSVWLPCGRICIATGMFLIDGRELLLWTWAHHPRYRWYRATELMTWTAMQRAVAAGCETFDLMGRGDFKKKFGAEPDETKWRWLRGRPQWLMRGRDLAEIVLRGKHMVSGQVGRIVARATDATEWRSNGSRRPQACVMGDIDLVRALGLAGIRAVVVAPPGSPVRFSRSTRACLQWSDPWEQQAQLVDALIDFSALQPEPPVLFYQEDRTLLLLSRNRERLGQAFRFVLPDEQLVEQLVDKAQFQKLAQHLDLPVPSARALAPGQQQPPADLEFPLLLKPLTRRPEQWEPLVGSGKAVSIASAAELEALWPDLAHAGATVLAQTLVPGGEHRMESYHVYVDDGGRVVAEFTGRKIRTSPAAFGDSTALEITDSPDVAELGRDIVARLDLKGVAKLDFKRGPDDRLHLLEVNPRFTLWHHLGARAGVNIPALVYGDLAGRKRPDIGPAKAGVHWCKVWKDRVAARENSVPTFEWLQWVIRCEAKSAVAWDDPVPLFAAGMHRWLSRLIRSNRNSARAHSNGAAWHEP